jgi:hypothetical protein
MSDRSSVLLKYRHWLLAGAMLAVVYFSQQWVLGKENGFLFDDFSHLAAVKQQTVDSIVHILPRMRYNDRPLGALTMKVMFQYFGLRFQAYHAILLFIHLFNAALLYRLVIKLLRPLDPQAESGVFIPFLTAVIFGVWPRSTFCVQWLAGIFDLLGATFGLWVFHLYLDYKHSDKYRVFNALLLLLVYFAGLRVKEMLLVLPAMLLVYDFFHATWSEGLNGQAVGKYRPTALLLALFVIMFAYYGYYLHLQAGENIINAANSPYYYTFNLKVLGTNLLRYFNLYFDYSNFAYGFVGFSAYGILGMAAVAAMLAAGIIQVVRRQPAVWLPFLGMLVISLLPVLPMKNMQHMLYWYIPSIFLSLLLAMGWNDLLGRWVRSRVALLGLNLVAAGLAVWLGWAQPVSQFRQGWENLTLRNQTSIADLRKLGGVEKGTTFYILGATDSENVFFYGPGAVNRLVFNDSSLVTILNPEKIDKKPPYVVLRYNLQDGHLTRIED